MQRYIVHNESVSGHYCCFEATVIDSTTGFEVCECPDKLDALTIASLLNGMERQKGQGFNFEDTMNAIDRAEKNLDSFI